MKSPFDMEFNEFVNWAVGYVLLGIGQGITLRTLIHDVVDHVCRNTIFGGSK